MVVGKVVEIWDNSPSTPPHPLKREEGEEKKEGLSTVIHKLPPEFWG
jgi:hypothetical protein